MQDVRCGDGQVQNAALVGAKAWHFCWSWPLVQSTSGIWTRQFWSVRNADDAAGIRLQYVCLMSLLYAQYDNDATVSAERQHLSTDADIELHYSHSQSTRISSSRAFTGPTTRCCFDYRCCAWDLATLSSCLVARQATPAADGIWIERRCIPYEFIRIGHALPNASLTDATWQTMLSLSRGAWSTCRVTLTSSSCPSCFLEI